MVKDSKNFRIAESLLNEKSWKKISLFSMSIVNGHSEGQQGLPDFRQFNK
jgi:hypothetical protein